MFYGRTGTIVTRARQQLCKQPDAETLPELALSSRCAVAYRDGRSCVGNG